jgi:DNA repair protein RecO (recombination protein O)
LTLDREAGSGEAIRADARYDFLLERGAVRKVGADGTAVNDRDEGRNGAEPAFRGKTLLDMAADDYSDPQTRVESRALMRQLIAHHLGGKPLQSRRVFMELQGMTNRFFGKTMEVA